MIILLDQDGPLADFENHFITVWKERYPQRPCIPYEQRRGFYLTGQYPAAYREDILALMHEPGFYRHMPVTPGAAEAVRRLEEHGHELFVCTSPLLRYDHCVLEKYQWVEEHFGMDLVERMIVTQDKTLVAGDVLIDDKPEVTGRRAPVWEHLIFDCPYNRTTATRRRLDWTTFSEVLDQGGPSGR